MHLYSTQINVYIQESAHTSPPNTRARRNISNEPNIQIVRIHETTFNTKANKIYRQQFKTSHQENIQDQNMVKYLNTNSHAYKIGTNQMLPFISVIFYSYYMLWIKKMAKNYAYSKLSIEWNKWVEKDN